MAKHPFDIEDENRMSANPRVDEVDSYWHKRGKMSDDEFRQAMVDKGYTADEVESVVQAYSTPSDTFMYPDPTTQAQPAQPVEPTKPAEPVEPAPQSQPATNSDLYTQYKEIKTSEFYTPELAKEYFKTKGFSDEEIDNVANVLTNNETEQSVKPERNDLKESYKTITTSEFYTPELAKEYLKTKGFSDEEIDNVAQQSLSDEFRILGAEEYKEMGKAYVEKGFKGIKEFLIKDHNFTEGEADRLIKDFQITNYIMTKGGMDTRMLKPEWFVTDDFKLSEEGQKELVRLYKEAPVGRGSWEETGEDLWNSIKTIAGDLTTGTARTIGDVLNKVGLWDKSEEERNKAISDMTGGVLGDWSDKVRRQHYLNTGINKADITDIPITDIIAPIKGGLKTLAKGAAIMGGGAYAHARGQGKDEGDALLAGGISAVAPSVISLASWGGKEAVGGAADIFRKLFVTNKQVAEDILANYKGDAQKFIDDLDYLKKMGITDLKMAEFVAPDTTTAWTARTNLFRALQDSKAEHILKNKDALNKAFDDVLNQIDTRNIKITDANGADIAAKDFTTLVEKYEEEVGHQVDKMFDNYRAIARQIPLKGGDKAFDKLHALADSVSSKLNISAGSGDVARQISEKVANYTATLKEGQYPTLEDIIDLRQLILDIGKENIGAKQVLGQVNKILDRLEDVSLKGNDFEPTYDALKKLAYDRSKDLKTTLKNPTESKYIGTWADGAKIDTKDVFKRFFAGEDVKIDKLGSVAKMYDELKKQPEMKLDITKEAFVKKFIDTAIKRVEDIKSPNAKVLELGKFVGSVGEFVNKHNAGQLKSLGIEEGFIKQIRLLGQYANSLKTLSTQNGGTSDQIINNLMHKTLDGLRYGLHHKWRKDETKRLTQIANQFRKAIKEAKAEPTKLQKAKRATKALGKEARLQATKYLNYPGGERD